MSGDIKYVLGWYGVPLSFGRHFAAGVKADVTAIFRPFRAIVKRHC